MRNNHADLIIHNCRIFDSGFPTIPSRDAVAIKENRIVAVAGASDLTSLAGTGTRKIDAGGRWLLPGLIDSHTHICEYASRKMQVELSDCHSKASALQKIREHLPGVAPGTWVLGGGWDKNRWGIEGNPDRVDLDQISTQHFIALKSKDWHSLWVNSAVLEKCGISATTADPGGGRIHRYANTGEPCGVLQERACAFVYQHIASPSLQEMEPHLIAAFEELHTYGITSVHSVETVQDYEYCNALHEQQRLGVRFFWYFPLTSLDQSRESGFFSGKGDHFLKICGVKMFSDGALGSQTADMLDRYEGLDHSGITVMSESEIKERLKQCIDLKLAAAIHAIGDRANRHVLNGFAAVHAESEALGLRHRIEHAQLLHPDDIGRFGKLGVIPSMQPIHLAEDIPLIRRYLGSRGRYAYAWNSLKQGGASVIFGSDTPIASFDPWKGLYSAIARREDCNPGNDPFYAAEVFTLKDALAGYTSNSAYAVMEEQDLGTIFEGKLADIILIDGELSDDIAEELLAVKVALTVQNGKIVRDAL